MHRGWDILRLFKRTTALIVLVLTVSACCLAQNQFEEAIRQLNSDIVKGYLQPFINSAGANINSGHFTTAQIDDLGFTLRFQIIAAGTLIGEDQKIYSVTPPAPFPQNPIETATVFGETGANVQGPANMTYYFQNGQIRANLFPSAVPQLTVGDLFGTQAVLRYASLPEIRSFPKSALFGIGAQHSVSRYLPSVPVDLSVGIYYNHLNVGDILEARAMCYGAHVSKSFAIVTAYGGLQYETATMDVNYTYTGQWSTPNTTISMQLESEVNFVATAGLDFNLGVLHINGDANFGKVTVLTAGIGFGI